MSQSTEPEPDDPIESLRDKREILEAVAEKDSPLSDRAEAALELLDEDDPEERDHS